MTPTALPATSHLRRPFSRNLLAPAALATLMALTGCAGAPSQFAYTVPAQPEGSSGYTEKPGWATEKFAVAAANPLATDAGYQSSKPAARPSMRPLPCRWC